MNPIATAQYGLFAATRRFEASAQRTAQMGDTSFDVDLGNEVVERVQAKHAFSANIAVIRTADEMQQSLLDLIA